MKPQITEYFDFTRSERNGAIGLILVCFIVIIYSYLCVFIPKYSNTNYTNYKSEIAAFKAAQMAGKEEKIQSDEAKPVELFTFDPNTVSVENLQKLGLSKQVANTIDKYRRKGGQFKDVDDLAKIYTLATHDFERLRPYIKLKTEVKTSVKVTKKQLIRPKIELFKFDPNTATKEDLLRLGLPENTAKAIVNYQSKGGNFKTKTDLKKIYTLSEADYARLEMYIEISLQKAAQYEKQLAFRKADERKSPEIYDTFSLRIDINQSTAEDWEQIRGVGAGYSKRIIQFRNVLGGFLSIEQVSQTYGLPDSIFQQMKPFLIESPLLSRIDINAATLDELKGHPYISWKQAKLLVNFRKQHGLYQSLEDIHKIRALKAEDIARFAPYLDFSE